MTTATTPKWRRSNERKTAIMLSSALVLEAITSGRYTLWSLVEYEMPPWQSGKEEGQGGEGEEWEKDGEMRRGTWQRREAKE